MTDHRQATADRYYAEGCALVNQGDEMWAVAHDSDVNPGERANALHAYRVNAMRARTQFRRHDAMLDLIQRGA